MLPVALKVDSLGLQVASADCFTYSHKEPYKHTTIELCVYFKHIYPEALLQDLPNGWYWTDYMTIEHKVICSCLSYEAEYVDTGAMSLDKTVEGVIGYLATRNKDGLMSVLTLIES